MSDRMGTIEVTIEVLQVLAERAKQVGTEHQFIDVAIKWAEGAEREIARLRAESVKLDDELTELKDCREALRRLGHFCGCDHVESADERVMQERHIEEAFTRLQDERDSFRDRVHQLEQSEPRWHDTFPGINAWYFVSLRSVDWNLCRPIGVVKIEDVSGVRFETRDEQLGHVDPCSLTGAVWFGPIRIPRKEQADFRKRGT